MPWLSVHSPEPVVVSLAGNPNAGKTTVFNRLTGARGRVGNYPGVTVDRQVAEITLPRGGVVQLVDVPGMYSLSARSPEEQIAADVLMPWTGSPPNLVVAVVDATVLERNLYLAWQLIETGAPVVIALTMTDLARQQGVEVDARELSFALGVPVVPIVASEGVGVPALLATIEHALDEHRPNVDLESLDEPLASDVREVETTLERLYPGAMPRMRMRARALWSLLSLGDDELTDVPDELRAVVAQCRARACAEGRDLDGEIVGRRYRRVEAIARRVLANARPTERAVGPSRSERIDAILTHPWLGVVIFLIVMVLFFEAMFAWSEPMVTVIEHMVTFVQERAARALPHGPFGDLLVHGVLAGVGNVVVFVPQIAILFLFLGLLEDSGYLARVAYLADRMMKGVGLHGRAFVPFLSGFACAIPAVMATRTMEHRKDRLVVMMSLPLISCSARLPVYTLIIASLFAGHHRVLGVLSVGSLLLMSMYALSLVATLATAALWRRTVLRGPVPELVLELPPYRMPLLSNLWVYAWRRVRTFLTDAGTVILALTVVLWALLSFPKDPQVQAKYEALQSQVRHEVPAAAQEQALQRLATQQAQEQMAHSMAGKLGHAIEPALKPLGFDWRIGVGIIGSFAAREVFVSTLGIVYGIGDTDGTSTPLREAIRQARDADGRRVFSPLVGLSLMVFFVFACQCISTLAVVRRESGSWRWPALMFVYMTALAYVASLAVYQVGSRLGGWG
jgi:ferrous iron transport protein B